MEAEGWQYVAVLVTKFKVLPSLVITPMYPDENYINESLSDIMPQLDIRVHQEHNVVCNCIDHSKPGKVLFQPIEPDVYNEEIIEDVRGLFGNNDGAINVENNSSEDEGDEDVRALKTCRQMLGNNEDVVVQLVFEPENLQDWNAIRFDVDLKGSWHPLQKIPKLTKAMRMGEIKSVSLSHVRGQYVLQQNRMMTGYFNIVKSSPWLKDVDSNTYNAVLNL